MFTEEEKRYIKRELGMDISFDNPTKEELVRVYVEAEGDVISDLCLRDRVMQKIENRIGDRI